MSDQGRNDTTKPTGSGRTWEHGENAEAFREGRRSAFAEVAAVYRTKDADGFAAYLRRVTGAR